MIRIDHKKNGDHVQTQWVSEDVAAHSNMGRLTFTQQQFDALRNHIDFSQQHSEQSDFKFEEKG